MGVAADEDRTGDTLRGAVLDHGLGDGQDVVLVEAAVQAGAPVPRRAEHHLLGGIRDVRRDLVIGGEQRLQVDQIFGKSAKAGAAMHQDIRTGVAQRDGSFP